MPTLDDELNSDTYGLLYPQKKTDYIPKTYYDISTADDLLKAMINGVQTCTRGIGVRYDNQNFSYWKSLYMDYINRSEMCNTIFAGLESPATQLFSKNMPYCNIELTKKDYNVEKDKEDSRHTPGKGCHHQTFPL